MAESSAPPAAPASLLIGRSKEEPSLNTESRSKEMNDSIFTDGSDREAKVHNVSSKELEEDDEVTPTPPESSPSLSENETMTIATTEDETLSVQLRHIKTEGGAGKGAEPGKSASRINKCLFQPCFSNKLMFYFTCVHSRPGGQIWSTTAFYEADYSPDAKLFQSIPPVCCDH